MKVKRTANWQGEGTSALDLLAPLHTDLSGG